MKNKLYIFSNNTINQFLNEFLADYELIFMNLNEIDIKQQNSQTNIIIINSYKDSKIVNCKDLSNNFLILSNLKKHKININENIRLLNTPVTISQIKNTIENFTQNLILYFHDISIDSEKIINLNNKIYCYLTKVEFEILKCLIREKEASKNFIKENILNIRSNIQTNSLESHLTRIRKKMYRVKTSVKIQMKSKKLSITS